MKSKFFIVLIFVLAAGGLLWRSFAAKKGAGGGASTAAPALAPETKTGASPQPPAPKNVVQIELVFGTEKREWIESAVAEFSKINPDILVKMTGRGSLEEAQAILDGKHQPVLFSPADSAALALLDADWQTKYQHSILESGDDAPQSLVISPLVFAIWEDRAQVLQKAAHGRISWRSIEKAVASNKGWPAIGGSADWGFVKLGHTDPTRSNSGLQSLLLMTFEYYNKTSNLTIGDLLDPAYQKFIGSLERGVPTFEGSTGTFMTDMIRFGPSRYDIAVVYENLVISQLENAQGRWGNLRVFYPETTLWSDHPIALLHGDWVNAEQQAAARRLIAFLRSRPQQERALLFGFRPADPSVPVRTADAQNPYTRLAQYGVKVEIPPVATLPDPPVLRNLITMWSRVVGSTRH
jgi:hypothetical protein